MSYIHKSTNLQFLLLIVFLFTSTLYARSYDSREGDSLAIVAMQEANPFSGLYWDLESKTLDDIYGIELNHEGRIEELLFSYKRISVLPPEIKNLTELRTFELTDNELTELPPEIGDLTFLSSLDIRSNNLKDLPSELNKLKYLSYIWISENDFESFPLVLLELERFRNLEYNKAGLTSFPPEILNITTLITLELEDNEISSLPEEIGNMPELDFVYMDGNSLSSIPKSLMNSNHLRRLWVNRNKLSFEVIEECLKHLPETVDFSYADQGTLPTYITKDSSFLFVSIGGEKTTYKWFENNVEIPNSNSDTLFIDKAILSNTMYKCEATSEIVKDLILTTSHIYTAAKEVSNDNFGNTITNLTDVELLKCTSNSITLRSHSSTSLSLRLTDLRGREVIDPMNATFPDGLHSIVLPSKLATGVYLLQVLHMGNSFVYRVMIQ